MPAQAAAGAGATASKAKKPCRAAKKGPLYRTPGYKGTCRSPKTRPQDPLPPVELGENGRDPQVLVDAAGTAHIVWNQDGGETGPDLLRYCRLKRGSRSCDNPPQTASLFPAQPGSPEFNDDIAGPRVVAVGDDLVFISHRYPNVVDKPDGASSRTTYMWVSDNGGNSVSGGVVVGDAEPSGGAVVFGTANGPRIGLISDTRTGGTYFQSINPGTYTGAEANLGEGGPDRAYSGSLVSVGGLPMTAFADLGGNTFIRQWSGNGDPANPATWSQSQTSGTEPRLAAGPSGAFLVTEPHAGTSLQVRRLAGITPQRATTVRTGGHGARDLFEDPGGSVRLAWVDRSRPVAELLERASTTGRKFEAARVVARASEGIDEVDLGATTDGGGFGLITAGGSSQGYGKILAAPFGTQAPTDLPGIGNLVGGGADPDTTTSCQEIAYRAVQILTDRGCYLGAIGKPGVKATEGSIRLNGLEIVPDAGVRILLGTREKTIDTTGKVTVQLRADGGPIVLFHGELHVKLPSGEAGAKLFSFDDAVFPVNVKGFGVSGDIDVILRKNAVEIPVQLELPKVFGGITGAATLRADNENGLSVDSVRFTVGKLLLGPLELSGIEVSWTNSTNTWTGGAGLKVLGAGMRVRLTFTNGRFTNGLAEITPVPFPGVKLAPDVFLNRVSGEFNLDPTFIEGRVYFGAQPLSPPDLYVYTVTGRLRVTVTPRFAIDAGGEGQIARIPVSEANVHADIDGYFSARGSAKFDLDAIKGEGRFDGFFDTSKGTFGGSIDSKVTIGVEPVTVDIGVAAGFSNEMVYGCYKPLGGFAYTFKTQDIDVSVGSCPGEPAVPEWVARELAEEQDMQNPPASAAQTDTPSFTLPAGLPSASVQVDGFSAAPNVTLISPSGARVTAIPINAAGAANAPAVFGKTATTTSFGLRRPAGGSWTVEQAQPGSVARVKVARELPKPVVKARVGGRGRNRVLTYTTTARKGLVVRFFERIGRGGRQIGVGKARKGRIRFQAGDGPGGNRRILASFEQSGMPLLQKNVASYRAPGPIVPARVRGLRVRRSGNALVARWKRASGTQRYVVRLDISDGRKLLRLVKGRSVRIGGLARDESARVKVTGRNAKGRTGSAAKAKLAKARKKRR